MQLAALDTGNGIASFKGLGPFGGKLAQYANLWHARRSVKLNRVKKIDLLAA